MAKKVRMSIQMKSELYEELRQLSEEHGASMSYYATMIISNHLNAYKKLYERLTSNDTMSSIVKEIASEYDYEYQVQCDYGKGYEIVTTEDNEEDAKRTYREYKEKDKKAKQIRLVQVAKID